MITALKNSPSLPGGVQSLNKQVFWGVEQAVLKVASVKLPFRRSSSKRPNASMDNNVGRPSATLGIRASSSSNSETAPDVLLPVTEVRSYYGAARDSCENDDFTSVVVSTSIREPLNLMRSSLEKSSKCGKSQLQLVSAESLAARHALSMRLPELGGDGIWMICNPLYFGYRHNSVRRQHFSSRRDRYTREITSMFYISGF